MRGVQVLGPRLVDAGEVTAARVLPAVREEPIEQPALIQDLDAAHVQAERTDLFGRFGLLLQHQHVHLVQPQFAGQHHAGRSATGDDHVGHEIPRARHP